MEGPRSRVALDKDKMKEVIAIISVGGKRQTAADYVGCAASTIGRTAARDPAFAARLQQAESQHEIRHLNNITKAADEPRYSRAAAWALERVHPDRYGPRRPHVVTADQINLVLSQLADLLIEEIPDEDCRARILSRVDALIAGLRETEDATSGEDQANQTATDANPPGELSEEGIDDVE